MASANLEIIQIQTNDDLNYLINRINQGPVFAEAFSFKCEELKERLFSFLEIDLFDSTQKYYYYDNEKNLHISESENGYIWISTMGLIATKRHTDIPNQFVNSCTYQYYTLSLLFDEAIRICKEESVYDIDSYYYEYLNEITPSLFHNTLFYLEIFGKAYLSLNNAKIIKTHKLSDIYSRVNSTMFTHKQNDTLFHLQIIAAFEAIIDYIKSIPDNFHEHFVKYDSNPGDYTAIQFNEVAMRNMKKTVDMSYEFIMDYTYENQSPRYLEQGLLDRLLNKAQNEAEKQKVYKAYSFLVNNQANEL